MDRRIQSDFAAAPSDAPSATRGRDAGMSGRPLGPVAVSKRFAVVALLAAAGALTTYLGLVTTEIGQRLENLALQGSALRAVAERSAGLDRLGQVSVAVFTAALLVVLAVAAVRRRPGLGLVLVGLMAGSVIVVEVLKLVLDRPALLDGPSWILRNSFPSGSAAVATAMAVGAILVSPDRLRWLVVPIGVAYSAIVCEAIQTTGWHRLSDAVGGALLVIAVVAGGLAVLARAGLVQSTPHGRIERRIRAALIIAGTVALAVAGVTLAIAVAFPLLVSPTGGRRVFLQTAFPLLGVGCVTLALVGFAAVVEPFTIGRGPAPADTDGRSNHEPALRSSAQTGT